MRINIHAKGAIMLIRQLECFCAVCETGSFTKAAGLLYVTQSAVSQQISSLEKELRVRLFKREGRVLSITDAGSLFYQKCRMILNDIDDAVCLLYTSPSPRDVEEARMPSSA